MGEACGETAMARQRLSVVVLTKNEAARIARCLDSVRWADDIVIVDGMSTDQTVAIAQAMGARVIRHPFEGSFAQERNLGLEHAAGEWVLQIDADDRVTPEFRRAIERFLARPSTDAAMKFRRKSYLLGRFMRYGGWYHYLPNMVRRDAVRYEGTVHERPVVRGTIGQLEADIEHHPCEDLTEFLARHNRYTSLQAQELLATRGRLSARAVRLQLLKRSWKVFWKSFIKKQGFREGMHGVVFALVFAGIELMKWAKYWELTREPEGTSARATPVTSGAIERHGSEGVRRRPTISIVLMTKNEEARLSACLDRVVGWADEIVVIDDCSTDRTVEIARRYTDRVFSFPSEDNHDLQWNRGIERAGGDWILHIDADEWVTPSLRSAIDNRLSDAEGYSAFELMRKNIFLGQPMRYGGWHHRHLVLFRRTHARCVGNAIHVQLQVDGRIGFLDAEIEHYPFATLAQFIERQNHYTAVEARRQFEACGPLPARTIAYQLTWRPVKLFWKSYVRNRGSREGTNGLVFGLLYAFVHILHWAKYWEQGLKIDQSTPTKSRQGATAFGRGCMARF